MLSIILCIKIQCIIHNCYLGANAQYYIICKNAYNVIIAKRQCSVLYCTILKMHIISSLLGTNATHYIIHKNMYNFIFVRYQCSVLCYMSNTYNFIIAVPMLLLNTFYPIIFLSSLLK